MTEQGIVPIEMKLSSVMQLFNSFDPAPFHEKALDENADEHIVETYKDYPPKTRFKIIIYLPDKDINTKISEEIPGAIRSHFEDRARGEKRKFRQRLVYGEVALLVGFSFLAIATITSTVLGTYSTQNPFAGFLANALTIAGWVAMWEPVTVLLFQLWPIDKQRKVYEKISRLEVNIRPYPRVAVQVPDIKYCTENQ